MIAGFNDPPQHGHKCHDVASDFEETLYSQGGSYLKEVMARDSSTLNLNNL